MHFSKYILAAFTSLIFCTIAHAQSGSPGMQQRGDMQSGPPSGMKDGKTGAERQAFDHQFLDTMSMHHARGIQMAELVKDHAAHDELKQIAQKMIDDEQKDIKQLQQMKEQWYAGKGDATNSRMRGMRESVQNHDKNMDKLRAAKDEKFDLMFIDMMSRHHTNGIRMAQQAISKAEHQEVKEFAKQIVEKQNQEKSEMAKMKKSWKEGNSKS
ncbi:DUF305 domain-containing protein [Oxalobacteraceae bacterium R-40]|uniref:DUF305 domain-containing protein n=1 Tax=Keguizhuia sedimenti TaxID=3064264 RepID=A0ABU1BM37_9BURK|nr:DUF305 domain-containing protein [Oxalobacteraceae bacterium R-40]